MSDVLLKEFCDRLRIELRPQLQFASEHPYHPVVVYHCPAPWQVLGTGNYAAVFIHPDFPDWVAKIYAPGRDGFAAEVDVYQRLGCHPAFSECHHAEDGYLVLKRLDGITLYDCLHQGIAIPPQVITEVDEALDYARQRGLTPHDVHGKNVMLSATGKGLVVDISDFLHSAPCHAWDDLKRAYAWIYQPIIAKLNLKIPYILLDQVRHLYRVWRRWAKG
ncbi:serine/threonine protein kinase [[Limnothrix rosea] IAM M-220]|uniref:serine/threonine protein kinase n=1 Tax=[Limnothrix rosea] IAM M-220 TaxID=454133 RepID=UPI00095C8AC2|nr:serine/threonine protein kinase [[Limnothrix rosea] IAM M-220]OKH17276.1 serine/threonine protein kinase [[Limnothrix rosea] IAM M-220]